MNYDELSKEELVALLQQAHEDIGNLKAELDDVKQEMRDYRDAVNRAAWERDTYDR